MAPALFRVPVFYLRYNILMFLHEKVFYAIIFFLFGILLASVKINFLIVSLAVLFISAALILINLIQSLGGKVPFTTTKKYLIFSALVLTAILGSFYYRVFENYQAQNTRIIFNQKIKFAGNVSDVLEQGQNQKLVVNLQNPYSGKIQIKLKPYPLYNYGDLINFEGKIEKPEQDYAQYLEKNKIFGLSNFPVNRLVSKNNGNEIKALLVSFKQKIISNFGTVLPADTSAFLSGLTLGEKAEFSQEFKNQMSQSGTTHLVALSGYNISVLVLAVSILLESFFSKRTTFWATIFIIIGFVVMAGAEASVVRAAIMGSILLLAIRAERIYSFRNAIVIAAFLMILANPKVLKFDVGFQLSFVALMGIVYLNPAIKKFFKINEETKGILEWKENFITTLSAQLAVAPMLILNFGNFSPVSLLTNILILSVIPLTMGLGFILGLLGFVSYYMSFIFSWFVNIFLAYEIFIIKFFGSLNILQFKSFNIFLAAFYYLILFIFIIRENRKKNKPFSAVKAPLPPAK